MKIYITNSAKETQAFAQRLAKKSSARIFLLTGQLGSGKTTFTQGFAKGLGIKEKIISPTYILIRQHPIPNTQKTFYHIDLYRLYKNSDINELGLKEILSDSNVVILIEWAEKAAEFLPKEAMRIDIKKNGDKRIFTIY